MTFGHFDDNGRVSVRARAHQSVNQKLLHNSTFVGAKKNPAHSIIVSRHDILAKNIESSDQKKSILESVSVSSKISQKVMTLAPTAKKKSLSFLIHSLFLLHTMDNTGNVGG